MPQIIFKGVRSKDIIEISKTLPEELAQMTKTPIDYFTIEESNSIFYKEGVQYEMFPLIEVKLFDRGFETEKKMAERIRETVLHKGYDLCEVFFTHIENDRYFD